MSPELAARRQLAKALTLVGLIVLTACSKAIKVDGNFPEPLVEPLPLVVGLQYSEALSRYSYTESLPDDATWSFELGTAHVELFDTVFGALFERVISVAPSAELSDIKQIEPGIDAVIVPAIDDFEFSLPRQARSDQFSVWIRYNLEVFDANGDLVTRWPITAYGQSDSRTFGGNESMEQAALKAMRDAAATIAIRFGTLPQVREKLLGENVTTDEPT